MSERKDLILHDQHNISFFKKSLTISELFNCPPPPPPYKEFPASAALTPQNFGVIDLRYHLATHNAAGDGLLDGLRGVAVVQGVIRIKVLRFFQQEGGRWLSQLPA